MVGIACQAGQAEFGIQKDNNPLSLKPSMQTVHGKPVGANDDWVTMTPIRSTDG